MRSFASAMTWFTVSVVTGQNLALDRASAEPPASSAPRFNEIEAYLERALQTGGFPSLSVGIVRQDRLVYARAFGIANRKSGQKATPGTLYRIGSITKVFTATLLAVLRDGGVVRLDDPVAKYLPPSVRVPNDPRGARAITLRHLATHTSGLPRLPVNLRGKDDDPYAGYGAAALYAGLAKTRLEAPIGARYQYSNLGVGLLGHALERAAGEPYELLLKKYIFGPVGMAHSTISLTSQQRAMFATGYRADDPRARAADWDLGVLAPAGGIASSVRDLAMFLALQLRAGQAGVKPIPGGTLVELHTPQRLTDGWQGAVGLAWHIAPSNEVGDVVWHNGGMAGYHSYMGFSPQHKVGVIVLTNIGKSVDAIGRRLLHDAVKTIGVRPRPEAEPEISNVADALAKHFVAEPPDALGNLFHEQFLASIPLARIKPIFRDYYQRLGRCLGVEVRPGRRQRRATVVFRFARGKTVQCEIEIDASDPPRLVYLYFPPGQ